MQTFGTKPCYVDQISLTLYGIMIDGRRHVQYKDPSTGKMTCYSKECPTCIVQNTKVVYVDGEYDPVRGGMKTTEKSHIVYTLYPRKTTNLDLNIYKTNDDYQAVERFRSEQRVLDFAKGLGAKIVWLKTCKDAKMDMEDDLRAEAEEKARPKCSHCHQSMPIPKTSTKKVGGKKGRFSKGGR